MFKHILIGIDFSSQSQQLYLFGNELASHFGSNLELVHVFHPTQQKGSLRVGKNIKQLQEYFQRKLTELGQKMTTDTPPPGFTESRTILRAVVKGFAEEELVKYSKRPEVELLILGIPGISLRQPLEFGRIVVEISQETHCPLLLLPVGAAFKTYQKILFLNEEMHLSDGLIEHMAGIAYFFSAEIHFIHIDREEDVNSGRFSFRTEFEQAIVHHPDLKIFLENFSSRGILEKINNYLGDHQIDFLNYVSTNRYYWNEFLKEKMGNTYSLSKNVPILINYLEDF